MKLDGYCNCMHFVLQLTVFSSFLPLSHKKIVNGSFPKAATVSRKCDFGLCRGHNLQEISSFSYLRFLVVKIVFLSNLFSEQSTKITYI